MIDSFKQLNEREAAYNTYIGYFKGNSFNVFEVLHNTLSVNKETTKEVLGSYFFDLYIKAIKDNLENIEADVKDMRDLLYCENDVEYDSFFHFKPLLEKIISELIGPQQPGAVKFETPVNQHPQIFKDDNFVIWQRMFDEFNITKSSRTDIDFMFEIMKYNSLIHDNIGFTDIQKWINEVYEIPFDKIKYTDPKQQSNKNRMIAYKLIIQNKAKV